MRKRVPQSLGDSDDIKKKDILKDKCELALAIKTCIVSITDNDDRLLITIAKYCERTVCLYESKVLIASDTKRTSS